MIFIFTPAKQELEQIWKLCKQFNLQANSPHTVSGSQARGTPYENYISASSSEGELSPPEDDPSSSSSMSDTSDDWEDRGSVLES